MIQADGGVIVWEPGELTTQSLADGLAAIGQSKLYPTSSNKLASLEDAAMDFARRALKPKRGCPVRAFRLGDGVQGYDIRVIHPHASQVDPVAAFSVVVDGSEQVKIVSYSPQLLPWMDDSSQLAKATYWIEAAYHQRRAMVHAGTVTSTVNNLLKTLRSTAVRQSGGVYWVPDSKLAEIDAFTRHVNNDKTGFSLNVWRSTVTPTDQSFRDIVQSIDKQLSDRLRDVEESLDNVTRVNANGAKTRVDECEELRALAEEYSAFLGEKVGVFKEMASALIEKVNLAVVMDVCA